MDEKSLTRCRLQLSSSRRYRRKSIVLCCRFGPWFLYTPTHTHTHTHIQSECVPASLIFQSNHRTRYYLGVAAAAAAAAIYITGLGTTSVTLSLLISLCCTNRGRRVGGWWAGSSSCTRVIDGFGLVSRSVDRSVGRLGEGGCAMHHIVCLFT